MSSEVFRLDWCQLAHRRLLTRKSVEKAELQQESNTSRANAFFVTRSRHAKRKKTWNLHTETLSESESESRELPSADFEREKEISSGLSDSCKAAEAL